MLFARLAVVLTLVAVTSLLSACSSPAANSNQTAVGHSNVANSTNSAPKDNVEEFADLVRLPFAPKEVAWKEVEGKGIIAVVGFSDENAEKMAAEAAKSGQPAAETLTVESWYPSELLAQSEMSGEATIKGQTYSATPFLNPPYTKGKLTRIENTHYFILQISS